MPKNQLLDVVNLRATMEIDPQSESHFRHFVCNIYVRFNILIY